MSAADVSKACGFKPGAISRYLYGDRRPERAPATKLLDVLGVPMEVWDLKTEASEAFVLPGAMPDVPASGTKLPEGVEDPANPDKTGSEG